jgi:hypothetical protein
VHENYVLFQDAYLHEIELFGKTEIITWLLMTIANDRSTHSESLSWNIYLMDDSCCHNVDKDGDHNNESPCDQLDCNFGILHSNARLK